MPERFYIVVREDDTKHVRHEDNQEAISEAMRLALKEGKIFYVLAAFHVVEPPRVTVRTI